MQKGAQADKQPQHLKNSRHLETPDTFAKTVLISQLLQYSGSPGIPAAQCQWIQNFLHLYQ